MNKLLKASSALFALAVVTIAQPAQSQVVVQQGATCAVAPACVSNCPSPSVLLMNNECTPSIVSQIVTAAPVVETATTFIVYTPGDLVIRRNDLLARVLVEQSRGALSASQAADLNCRINAVDARRAALSCPGSVAYYQDIKRIYRSYDHIADIMKGMSGLDNRELAGTYFVL